MQNQLQISNTDVITMLVVKNRKHLQEKKLNFQKEYFKIRSQMLRIVLDAINEELEKENIKNIIASYKSLFEVILLNNKLQKIEFDIVCRELKIDDLAYLTRGNMRKKASFNNLTLEPVVKDENNENIFFDTIDNGLTQLQINCNIQVEIPQELIDNHDILSEEINKIDKLLANENKMKEELVAKVTENAIANSPVLKGIIGADMNEFLLLE